MEFAMNPAGGGEVVEKWVVLTDWHRKVDDREE